MALKCTVGAPEVQLRVRALHVKYTLGASHWPQLFEAIIVLRPPSCLVPPSLLVLPGARPRAVVCLLFLLLARSRPRGPWVIRFCVCCSLPPHVVLPGSDPEEGQVPETLVYHRPSFTSHARSQIYISMPRLHANVVKVLYNRC